HSKGAADDAERARRKATYEFLVPIVKAFCTESAVEVTSLGVQVHGGMGYIEETGAAQYYRDARILPIYEGTTAIQANDFVGRKILRDGGAVAMDVAQQIQVTIDELRSAAPNAGADSEALNLIAERLSRSLEAYTSAIQYVLERSKRDLNGVYMGSVPLLMLAGLVYGGWQMARAALACHRGTSNSDDFRRRKLTTAVFYAAQL